jgi:hypothetical protein
VVQAGAKGGLDKHPRCSTRALRALRACRVGLFTGCPGERERDDVARQSRPIPAGVSCVCLGTAPAHVRHRIRLTGLTAGPHQRSPVCRSNACCIETRDALLFPRTRPTQVSVACPNSLHRRRAVPSGEDALDRGLIKRWLGLNRTHRCQLTWCLTGFNKLLPGHLSTSWLGLCRCLCRGDLFYNAKCLPGKV